MVTADPMQLTTKSVIITKYLSFCLGIRNELIRAHPQCLINGEVNIFRSNKNAKFTPHKTWHHFEALQEIEPRERVFATTTPAGLPSCTYPGGGYASCSYLTRPLMSSLKLNKIIIKLFHKKGCHRPIPIFFTKRDAKPG